MNKIKINWFGKFIAMLVAFCTLSVGAKAAPITLNDIYQYPEMSGWPNELDGKQTYTSWWESMGVVYVGISTSWYDANGVSKNVTIVTQEIVGGLLYTEFYYNYGAVEVFHSEAYRDNAYGWPTSVTFSLYVSPVGTNPLNVDTNPSIIHVY